MSWPYLAPLDFGLGQSDYLLVQPALDSTQYQQLVTQHNPLPSPSNSYYGGHAYQQQSTYPPAANAAMSVDIDFLNSLMASLQEFATMPTQPTTPPYPRTMAYTPSSSEFQSTLPSTAPSPPPAMLTVSPSSRLEKPPRRRRSSPLSSSRGESTSPTSPKMCSHCRTTTTPLWRRDPQSSALLCNACGLYLQQHDKLRPQQLIDADALEEEDEPPEGHTGRICSHCKAHKTSVWRRSAEGKTICNACGVYKRLKGVERPIIYKQKKIKPRTRHVDRASVR